MAASGIVCVSHAVRVRFWYNTKITATADVKEVYLKSAQLWAFERGSFAASYVPDTAQDVFIRDLDDVVLFL